ncbi:MAG: TetR/AcrR family transcriptional regulator [Thermomonas sp.]|jgi:AcrR family transcriptional regulator|uniref:TetR/AcrR family transcriptional regulator n=1 Tax=Thermomonas sp. TaxID=1971895 RepID=UPI001ED72791|nr:TetR/AcrR family transcriptional regulator [Thermomonas sp.]MBV2208970.1 TetR/AcrR family transcriptional regulator [Thermomonas sp.]
MADPSRAQAQRKRILDAAQTCFAERGFHGASMAKIAETAQMSPGLIYRYFESKSQIIRSIVELQLEQIADEINHPKHSHQSLAEHMFDDFYTRRRRHEDDRLWMDPGLIMEISAEAARDPVIGVALRRFDETVQARIEDWLRKPQTQGGLGIAEADVPAKALMLRLVIEGLKVRQTRQPDLDPALLRRCLDQLVQPLLG